MQPIDQHELRGHIQRLREIFNRRLEIAHGDNYQLENVPLLGPGIYLTLQRNSCTSDVTNDRGEQVVCGVLASMQTKRILCSFFEGWKLSGKTRVQFDKTWMTFFLEFTERGSLTTKQIFRLEWDNWQIQETKDKAAYPHWQFDQWLTASDMQAIEKLRKDFEIPGIEPGETLMPFESAEEQLQIDRRPNLPWFTKLHFPAVANWAAN